MKTLRYLFLCILLLGANAAFAGPYSDALGKKLVASTTPEEKAVFVRWMFVAMALHPDLKGLSSITPEQREETNRALGKLFTRLLTETCVVEAREAVKYEGPAAIESAFSLLGQIAARELFINNEVKAGLADLDKYLDAKALANALQLPK